MGYWLGTLCFAAVQLLVIVCINTFEKKSRHGCETALQGSVCEYHLCAARHSYRSCALPRPRRLAHTLAITAVVQCWML